FLATAPFSRHCLAVPRGVRRGGLCDVARNRRRRASNRTLCGESHAGFVARELEPFLIGHFRRLLSGWCLSDRIGFSLVRNPVFPVFDEEARAAAILRLHYLSAVAIRINGGG